MPSGLYKFTTVCMASIVHCRKSLSYLFLTLYLSVYDAPCFFAISYTTFFYLLNLFITIVFRKEIITVLKAFITALDKLYHKSFLASFFRILNAPVA